MQYVPKHSSNDEKLTSVIKPYAYPVVVACCIWIATIPNIWVVFGQFNTHLLIAKLLQFPMLCVGVVGLQWLIANYQHGSNTGYCVALFSYCLLYSVLLLVIWPGGWRWDDINVLEATVSTATWPIWQGYLTTLFYMVCLITVPIPAFIVFAQVVIISHLATQIVTRVASMLGGGNAALFVTAFVVGLLPPVLNMNLYPLRSAIHSYLEVLLLVSIGELYQSGRHWTWKTVVRISSLTALVAAIKSECIIFVGIVPILVLLLGVRGERLRSAGAVFGLSMVLVFGLSLYQRYGPAGGESARSYELTVYAPSLPYYAHEALRNGDEAFIDSMSEVFDVQVLNRAYEEGAHGETVYWNEDDWPYITVPQEQRDSGFYDRAKSLFIMGSFKYPTTMIRSRWEQFVEYNGFQWSPNRTNDVFSKNDGTYGVFKTNYILNAPLSKRVRHYVTSYMEASGPFSCLAWTYNLAMPLAIVVFATIWLACRRSLLALLPLALIGHNVVIFLAAPSYYFMYYYSLYVGAMFALAGFVSYYSNRRHEKRGARSE